MAVEGKGCWYEQPLWKYFLLPVAVAVIAGLLVSWMTGRS